MEARLSPSWECADVCCSITKDCNGDVVAPLDFGGVGSTCCDRNSGADDREGRQQFDLGPNRSSKLSEVLNGLSAAATSSPNVTTDESCSVPSASAVAIA